MLYILNRKVTENGKIIIMHKVKTCQLTTCR